MITGSKIMARRFDGDDSAFPVKGKPPKQDRQTVGEANPNSRAANWLREAAKKPPIAKDQEDVNQTEHTTEDDTVERGSRREALVGELLDEALSDLVGYVSQLEFTLLQVYKDVERLKGIEQDFRALQTIVMAIQQTQNRYNFIPIQSFPNQSDPVYPPPNTYTSYPTITTTHSQVAPPLDNPPRMRTDEMDKE